MLPEPSRAQLGRAAEVDSHVREVAGDHAVDRAVAALVEQQVDGWSTAATSSALGAGRDAATLDAALDPAGGAKDDRCE
jgi:hypothetical protein